MALKVNHWFDKEILYVMIFTNPIKYLCLLFRCQLNILFNGKNDGHVSTQNDYIPEYKIVLCSDVSRILLK